MVIADPALASEKAQDLVQAMARSGNAHVNGRWREYDSEVRIVRGLLPLMREIANSVHPVVAADLWESEDGEVDESLRPVWPWRDAYAATQELCGVLEHWEERRQILGPTGPILAATRLHEWVWDAAKSRWDDGYYDDAVHAAAESVNQKTQVKLNRRDLSGTELYQQAFSPVDALPEQPRLRLQFVELEDKDTWKSAHLGAMKLGEACFQGFRNLVAHKKAALNEQEALEQLGALSTLARWVDSSEVLAASPDYS